MTFSFYKYVHFRSVFTLGLYLEILDIPTNFLFQTMLENYTFLPFSMFLAVFWIFTYKKVPETKNKTFDEIATLFKIQNKQKLVH